MIFVPLSVADQTTVSPDPEAYLNVTVFALVVEFLTMYQFSISRGIVTPLDPVIAPVNSITLLHAVPVNAPSSTSKAVSPAPPAIVLLIRSLIYSI